MDDKASCQNQVKKRKRYSVDGKRFMRQAYKLMLAHRRTCLTGILCVAFIALLYGIAAQLPIPIANNAPANVRHSLVKAVAAAGSIGS